ncbi:MULTISPECIES: S66 peptidase family protein [unclassified Rhizobium]|uniref:S66 peptidase family protein n=1 Tax=unclassified Rhizobium TaxID=2613769 RepID=UPI001ADB046D|nr:MULTISPECIES: LD-carboxypeptidase [unclassified Rhizobium]MBO9097845.1 LD-carboxypeptidase [Rhizobium sp. L58/93]MBO9133372.1 LD-carboxypeptidase [Rhizobium sp. B209b/85]MBO9167996.1 LD-carboxypeptidase [Rhizobium sp. L245/93]MBO9184041.1 LD-carboxypeptidase [Rhizobium sp. E27B/91]QXZ84265.1 LD-carboxypeptidase [Rhizobium sp. K1/93]
MAVIPPKLTVGDRVRLVSPASPPERESVLAQTAILERWGLQVEFGDHIFDKKGYLAGEDDDRLADVNAAFMDPGIRAIFATRGGKGSYRIADRLDFDAVRRDPKFMVGFSDITALHLSLYRHCGLVGLHGAVMRNADGAFDAENCEAMHEALMLPGHASIFSRPAELTAALTTSGHVRGPLIGGNLDMVATTAGWALPPLAGAILLLEAVNMTRGQLDRQLTMLRKAGHLQGVAGIALGQFTGFETPRVMSAIDILREHLETLGVPVLGGLPLGHGMSPLVVPIGRDAVLDTESLTLSFPD